MFIRLHSPIVNCQIDEKSFDLTTANQIILRNKIKCERKWTIERTESEKKNGNLSWVANCFHSSCFVCLRVEMRQFLLISILFFFSGIRSSSSFFSFWFIFETHFLSIFTLRCHLLSLRSMKFRCRRAFYLNRHSFILSSPISKRFRTCFFRSFFPSLFSISLFSQFFNAILSHENTRKKKYKFPTDFVHKKILAHSFAMCTGIPMIFLLFVLLNFINRFNMQWNFTQ